MRYNYTVIVGNVGTIYSGLSITKAKKLYQQYVEVSKTCESARAFGEDVTLMCYDEILEEHQGHLCLNS